MNLLFSNFYVKSTLEALQGHTVVTVTIFLKVDLLNLKLISRRPGWNGKERQQRNSLTLFTMESVSTFLYFLCQLCTLYRDCRRAAVVHLNFRAGSTFPIPVCTVPSSMDRTSRYNKVDAVRLYASNRLNLILLEGQGCVASLYLESGISNSQRFL